jgi:CRISPR/Cas system-associated protein Cas7 (RAMP superfamily)
MVSQNHISEEQKNMQWQSILDEYADNFDSELSKELSEQTGVKLKNNEVKVTGKNLFEPERAKVIFDHIFSKIIKN